MAGVYIEALQQLQAILRIPEVDASDCLKVFLSETPVFGTLPAYPLQQACNNDVNHAAEYYLNGDLERVTAPARDGYGYLYTKWRCGDDCRRVKGPSGMKPPSLRREKALTATQTTGIPVRLMRRSSTHY
jgi:hypothetical protein